MARTKGAKDSKPRKKAIPRGTGGRFQKKSTEPRESALQGAAAVERPALPIDDFKSAIAAELQQAPSLPEPGTGPQPSEVSPQSGPAPADGFDPSALTLAGLASAWQVPFWALGWILTALKIVPSPDAIVDVGRRRAADLAKPSYEIYAHYARQYLQLNPDNTVHVAAGVTGLNAIGILPDLTEAIVKSRRQWADQIRRAQQAQQVPPAAGG